MKANPKYVNKPAEFWANIKLINQKLGYVRRVSKKYPNGGFLIPTEKEIIAKFKDLGIAFSHLIQDGSFTDFGLEVIGYMEYRDEILINSVESNLMDKKEAKDIFYTLKKKHTPSCPLPFNKQKGDKKDYAYLTGIVNILIEHEIGNHQCDYDPKILTNIIRDNSPIYSMSRRVDGAFPSPTNPMAIWEIKEYYHTTTFGSRIADGVYETQLDGWELLDIEELYGIEIDHYLIVDSHYTWWGMGRSYLCRLVDIIHMGLVTEVLFGKEVLDIIPQIAKNWVTKMEEGKIVNLKAVAEKKEDYTKK